MNINIKVLLHDFLPSFLFSFLFYVDGVSHIYLSPPLLPILNFTLIYCTYPHISPNNLYPLFISFTSLLISFIFFNYLLDNLNIIFLSTYLNHLNLFSTFFLTKFLNNVFTDKKIKYYYCVLFYYTSSLFLME